MNSLVLIVEDDARFREAFAAAVTQADDMTLIGTAADYASGLGLLKKLPDVMLVDLELPDGNGIGLIREAAKLLPQCDVMVVTVFGDERHVLQSIEAGATGYLLKDLPPAELVEQIRVLRAGGSPISPIIARQLLTRFTHTEVNAPAGVDKDECSPLSAQEVKVLSLTAKGYSYDEIANLMQISRHTVQTYVKRIYRKLQVNSKFEALFEARRLRLIAQ
ncbi:MAG: response regulator transcription factor [Steroidobacteraceae bacterium]